MTLNNLAWEKLLTSAKQYMDFGWINQKNSREIKENRKCDLETKRFPQFHTKNYLRPRESKYPHQSSTLMGFGFKCTVGFFHCHKKIVSNRDT